MRYLVTTYKRQSPLADMFVPIRESIALPKERALRAGTLVAALMMIIATPVLVTESATLAYFSDIERSIGNTFAAGPLDITAIVDHDTATLAPEAPEIFNFTVMPTAGSLPLVYEVNTFKSGDADFCNALALNGVPVAPSNNFAPWQVDIEYGGGAEEGAQCQVDFTFHAYQEGGALGTEYHDVEMISLMLTADTPLNIQEFFAPTSFSIQSFDAPVEEEDLQTEEDTPSADEPAPPDDVEEAEESVEETETIVEEATEGEKAQEEETAPAEDLVVEKSVIEETPPVEEPVVEESMTEETGAVEETLAQEPPAETTE